MTDTNDLIALNSEIVSAHVSNSSVAIGDVADLIRSVYDALNKVGQPAHTEAPKAEPAVSIRQSVKPDYIVCLEDGAKLKMLKRYLQTRFQMTPEEYRAKWGLPRDYPMVAPNYTEERKTLAQKTGLGRRAGSAVATAADSVKGPVKKTAKSAGEAVETARKRVTSKTEAAPKATAKPAVKRGRPPPRRRKLFRSTITPDRPFLFS